MASAIHQNLHYLPYHEPSLAQILVLSSFIILLNTFRWVFDILANVGIIGELAVGLIFGPPGAEILESDWESTITAIGYIGLIIIVLEGGLSTDLTLARRNLVLSFAVALVGILAPILLSLVLLHLALGFTLLQAFTAGAALSATSLGTTFSVIQQAGFGDTRLGAVLVSAAVTDDVVGLILLQVVVSLGAVTSEGSTGQQDALVGWAIGRPLLASMAMLVVSFILMKIVGPIYGWMTVKLPLTTASRAHSYNLIVAIVVAFAYSAVASVSGSKRISKHDFSGSLPSSASVLLGAFVCGLILASLGKTFKNAHPSLPSFSETYTAHIHKVQLYLLRPFFFASIGYAIPIRSLFTGRIVWQGIVYSLLGIFTKVICGSLVLVDYQWKKTRRSKGRPGKVKPAAAVAISAKESDSTIDRQEAVTFPPSPKGSQKVDKTTPSLWSVALLLGSAMVARGEISLLIANLAQVNSPQLMPDDLFYITIWAVVLCTVVGPVTVGLLVKRMQKQGSVLPTEWGPMVKHAHGSGKESAAILRDNTRHQ